MVLILFNNTIYAVIIDTNVPRGTFYNRPLLGLLIAIILCLQFNVYRAPVVQWIEQDTPNV